MDEPPSSIKCPTCGTSLPAGAKFCNVCGTKLVPNAPMNPQIVRHQGPAQTSIVVPASDGCEAISNHIKKYLGPIKSVFHEIVSSGIHIDVHWVAPDERRPIHILVTSGMSDLPMNVPSGAEKYKYAELLVALPKTWPVSTEAFKDEQNYWPVRLLKILARLPYEYNTWLGYGHDVPNGDPPRPYAKNTRFCCALILPPIPLPVEFCQLKINDQKIVNFYSIIPLYVEEMNFKLHHDTDALTALFDKYRVNSLINVNRPNACKSP